MKRTEEETKSLAEQFVHDFFATIDNDRPFTLAVYNILGKRLGYRDESTSDAIVSIAARYLSDLTAPDDVRKMAGSLLTQYESEIGK